MAAKENIQGLQDRLIAGELDSLTPEQIAALAADLDSMAQQGGAWVDRLAGAKPPAGEPLVTAARAWEQQAAPTAAEWRRIWQHVEDAPATWAESAGKGSGVRRLRLWRPVLAAAACLLLAIGWQMQAPAPSGSLGGSSWPLRLARDAEIRQLDVGDDATSIIVTTGDSGVQVIWVLEEQT